MMMDIRVDGHQIGGTEAELSDRRYRERRRRKREGWRRRQKGEEEEGATRKIENISPGERVRSKGEDISTR